MATHSSILILWTEEPVRLQSTESSQESDTTQRYLSSFSLLKPRLFRNKVYFSGYCFVFCFGMVTEKEILEECGVKFLDSPSDPGTKQTYDKILIYKIRAGEKPQCIKSVKHSLTCRVPDVKDHWSFPEQTFQFITRFSYIPCTVLNMKPSS